MTTSHHPFLRWLPSLLWGIAILVLSLMPGGTGAFTIFGLPHIDKLGHFGMYAGWTFLIYLALRGYPHLSPSKTFWGVVFAGSLIGVLLEVGQLVMRLGRNFEWADMAANALGAIAGAVLGKYVFEYFRPSGHGRTRR